jgi:hypothetical protein
MKRASPIVILLLLLSCFTSAKTTSARTWEPGVSKGDFFYYEIYGVFTSSNSDAVINVSPFERNNTDWLRIDINDVNGSIVHQVYTMQFKNGTQSVFAKQTDIDPSNHNSYDFTPDTGIPICATKLGVGDKLPTVQLAVNKTFVKTYPSGERETNVVSWNFSDDWGYCYFDKKTGMLVELNRVHSFVNLNTGEAVNKTDILRMTRSSLWEVSGAPAKIVLPLFIIYVLLIVTVVVVTRKPKPVKSKLAAEKMLSSHIRKRKVDLAEFHENHFSG